MNIMIISNDVEINTVIYCPALHGSAFPAAPFRIVVFLKKHKCVRNTELNEAEVTNNC